MEKYSELNEQEFYCRLHAHLGHPIALRSELEGLINKLDIWEDYSKKLMDSAISGDALSQALSAIALDLNLSEYLLQYAVLFKAAHPLWIKYKVKGLEEWVFWDTILDMKSKLEECMAMYAQWGTFVFSWYPEFFRLQRFGLGRLQYDVSTFPKEAYTRNGVTVRKGQPAFPCHIPSGRPMPREARLDSYRKAYAFFGEKPLVITCNSWLLYPPLREMLPEGSAILDFMNDFDIIQSIDHTEKFGDAWRIFGPAGHEPPEQWPTDNSLRKAYAQRILQNLPGGTGFGVLVFDGEKIINI